MSLTSLSEDLRFRISVARFSQIAMTPHHLVNLDFLNKIISVDAERQVVKVRVVDAAGRPVPSGDFFIEHLCDVYCRCKLALDCGN